MKKIKISELPLYQSLKGLFVMGTDVNNRSVKVNLEFIETETTEAVKQAQAAVSAAEKATGLANNATQAADTAATQAQAATNTANAAAQAAQKAKQDADAATKAATKAAQEATEAADEATEAAEKATEAVLDTLGILVPTGLKAECLSRLTIGKEPIYIKTELTPETAMKNLIFISTGDAVEVGQDGRLTPVRKGYSHVHVIPTCNTALAQSFLIEVGEPTVRLVRSNAIRFTQSGAFRMN